MPDPGPLSVLGLGFVLGLRHALDADHLAAVSTILSARPDLRRSGLIGCSWGVGHTAMLLAVGLAVLALRVTIPEGLARAFEFGVGLMLVVLGLSLARRVARERWHWHLHRHDEATHAHLHRHRLEAEHRHEHWLALSTRPFLVGMVHGLAGSAALMLLVLSLARSLWEGLAYILLFGIGSILGMGLVGGLISLPLVLSARTGPRVLAVAQSLACLGSIGLGIVTMVRTGLGSP